MNDTLYKKYLGIGFIVLFGILTLSYLVHLTPLTWWHVLVALIAMGAVVIIAFIPRSQSSALSKIGACLYITLFLINIANNLSFIFTGDSLLYYPVVSEYVCSLALYAPGFMLLIWGTKLWLPAKITASAEVAFSVIQDMFYARIASAFDSGEFIHEQIESLYDTAGIIGAITEVLILASLTLTVIWLCRKPKAPAI